MFSQPSEDPKVIINQILLGFKSAELFLNFLHKNNKSDLTILKSTKVSHDGVLLVFDEAAVRPVQTINHLKFALRTTVFILPCSTLTDKPTGSP